MANPRYRLPSWLSPRLSGSAFSSAVPLVRQLATADALRQVLGLHPYLPGLPRVLRWRQPGIALFLFRFYRHPINLFGYLYSDLI